MESAIDHFLSATKLIFNCEAFPRTKVLNFFFWIKLSFSYSKVNQNNMNKS